MTRILSRRLPNFRDILPVYAIIAFMVYGWTLFTYLRYLQYWLRFLNIREILAIFCYSMLADLAESLFILFILLGICLISPAKVLKDTFVVRGTSLVVCTLASVFVFLNNFTDLNAYMNMALPWAVATILGAILIAFFATRLAFVGKAARWLSDSMTIFLYIFLPVTAISLITVIVRNIV